MLASEARHRTGQWTLLCLHHDRRQLEHERRLIVDLARDAAMRASSLVVSEISATGTLRSPLGRIDHLGFLEDVHTSSESLKGLVDLLDDRRRSARTRASSLVVSERTTPSTLRSPLSRRDHLGFLEDVHAPSKSLKDTVVERARLAVVARLTASSTHHVSKYGEKNSENSENSENYMNLR